jgi:Dolichyl-phosphate-mannose-protein mannosyltransferase
MNSAVSKLQARSTDGSPLEPTEGTASPCRGEQAGGEWRVLSLVQGSGWYTWLGIIGIVLLFVALRWHRCDAPLIRDEGEYAYAAQMLRSGIAPYEHSFLQKPPMVIYSYALAEVIAPSVFWAPRLLAYLFAAGATVLLGFIVRLEFGAGFALPAMWLFTPMVLLPGVDQSIANTEMFLLLPLLACFALYVFSRHQGSSSVVWFLVGFFGAVALGYKYTALPLLTALYAGWSIEEWRRGTSPGVLCRRWLFGMLGGGIAGMAVLGFFLVRDGGRHLWECTVLFNRAYAASSNFGLHRIWVRLLEFWADWWILFLLPCSLFIKPRGRVWFWIAMFLAAWLTTGASYYRQYYVLVMPFWALLTAVAIKRLACWAASRSAWSEMWATRMFTALVLVMLCLPDLTTVVPTKQQLANEQFDPLNPFPESPLVARRVAELTSPQDYVFVAGSEPQILYYAQRFSPTRFVIAYPLMIPTPLSRTFQQEAIRELERHPPSVVVRARSHTSWLDQAGTPPDFMNYLDKMLAENYERVGGYVLGSQNGRWVEPLPDQDLLNASLVLFRRRSVPGG